MHNTRKCTRSKEASPRPTSGVRFSAVNVFPGYAKNAYPGLMYVHASGVASPKGCKELSPGWSVLCVPGVKVYAGECTPEGVRGLSWTAMVYDRRYNTVAL